MTEFKAKILCIDDEIDILHYYEDIIKHYNFTPITTPDPKEAIAIYEQSHSEIALVISDYMMKEMTGFEFRKAIMPISTAVPFVIISAYVTREMALAGLELKINSFNDKPFTEADFAKILAKEATPRAEAIRESRQLEAIFIDEAQSIVEDMEPLLLSLEADRSNVETMNLLFRAAHTIKGSSGVLETDIIAKYVHKYEDIISAVRKDPSTFSDEIFQSLLCGYDRIKSLIAMIPDRTIGRIKLADILTDLQPAKSATKVAKPSESEPLAGHGPQKQTQKVKDFIPVPLGLLDDLAGLSGEITVIRNMVNKLVRSLEVKFSGEKDIQSLGELFDEMHKINSSIQSRITDLRKIPLTGIIKPISRILRDLGKETKKKYRLVVKGESLRIDNSLAQVCSNSLVHLIRNSADHGIESPADRLKAQKPEEGSITIDCHEERDQVVISVADDGKGLDVQRIKAKAKEKNLRTQAELESMNEAELMDLIFLPGFSTAAQVTDISGRGVGMDMVRASVDAVGGKIKIKSTPGAGSTFYLNLPIPRSILIINSLLIHVANRQFAIAQDDILRVLRFSPEDFKRHQLDASGSKVLHWQNQIYPLLNLRTILKIPGEWSPPVLDTVDILILKGETFCYALEVDQILDIEEIVVKRLQECINFQSIFSGATFLGDGQIGLILDARSIAMVANLKPTSPLKENFTGKSLNHPSNKEAMNDYVLFKLNSRATFGAPLAGIFRLESFDSSQVQLSGQKKVIIYRDTLMPLVKIDEILKLESTLAPDLPGPKSAAILVIQKNQHYIGLEVNELLDIAKSEAKIDQRVRDRPEILGNVSIDKKTITVLDLESIKSRYFAEI